MENQIACETCVRNLAKLPKVHDQKLGFCHLVDGISEAFATESGIFHAAIWHVIDAEGGHIAGDHAADFQFGVGVEQELYIAGKNARL